MEFRENYLGIPARIRFDNQTNSYVCDIDTPEALTWTPPVCQVTSIDERESIAVLHPAC
jgi:hypothetical protein